MKILALDPGTKTGWAWRGEDGLIMSGMMDFNLRRGDSPGMKYIIFTNWLGKLYDSYPFDLVYYEQPHMRGGYSTEVLYGFVTHLQTWCATKSVNHTAVHTGTLKKSTTGHGKASKSMMMEEAKHIAGKEIESDDEADAICLLAYAERRHKQ